MRQKTSETQAGDPRCGGKVRGKSHQVVMRSGKRRGSLRRWRGLLPTSARGRFRWLRPRGPWRRCGGLPPCGCGPGRWRRLLCVGHRLRLLQLPGSDPDWIRGSVSQFGALCDDRFRFVLFRLRARDHRAALKSRKGAGGR